MHDTELSSLFNVYNYLLSFIENIDIKSLSLVDHVLINQYEATEGILHHTDGPVYLDTVAILSLSSSCLMTFRNKFNSEDIGKDDSVSEDVFSVLLQPRSLLVFSGIIYTQFMHGIADGTDGICQIVGSTAPCINMTLANVIEGQKVI